MTDCRSPLQGQIDNIYSVVRVFHIRAGAALATMGDLFVGVELAFLTEEGAWSLDFEKAKSFATLSDARSHCYARSADWLSQGYHCSIWMFDVMEFVELETVTTRRQALAAVQW